MYRSPHGTSHGSPYDYDTHVPLIFSRKQFRSKNKNSYQATVDIAPTIAKYLESKSLLIVMGDPIDFEMLKITNLTKQFKRIKAVDNISLEVQKGDVYGFLGPNGAGKTTSIRMIMGIIKPDKGNIKLNGLDINKIDRKKLGYLPEDRGLYQKQNLVKFYIILVV